MDEIQLNEIREGTGCPDVEELKPPPLCPGRSDGSVSMETREEEERRWRRRYPEIKKCVILIKKLLKGEKDKMGSRSGDPEVAYDWIEPLRPKVIRRSRVRRFVKRMEFSVNVCNGKPRGRGRGRGLLRLRCCTGEDGVHIGPRQRAKGQVTTKKHKNSINLSETEHNYSNQSHDGRTSTTCGQNDGKSTKKKPPKIVFTKVAEKKWVLGRSKVKQQPEEEEVVGGSGITTENMKEITPSHATVLKRMKRLNPCGQCVACLRKNCGKCPFCLDKKEFGGAARQKQRCINRRCLERLKPKNLPRGMDAEKDVEEETVTTTTKRQQQLNSRKLKRQKTEEKKNKEEEERLKPKNLPRGTEAEKDVDEEVAGKKWVLRRSKVKKQQPEEVKEEVGGSGITTINKRKKRQNSCGQCVACLRENCGKCPFCLDKKEFGGAERRRQRCINRRCLVRLRTKKLIRWMEAEKDTKEETVTTTTKHQQRPNSGKLKRQNTEEKKNKEEEEEVVEKRWVKQWWLKRRGKRRQRASKKKKKKKKGKWTPPTEAMLEENEDLHHNGVLTGTHVQEDSVFHAYTGVPYVPTPSPAPPPLHRLSPLPKVEEEEVDINVCRIMEDRIGWEQEDKVKGEELLYTEVMWEQERFYDIEVQLQESDEETDTCPSDCDDKDGQAVTSDLEYEPPESISLWSSSLSPLGDDSSDDVTCGRGWLQLLKALWTTMLPAQWVVVVAEGPELQLLQCSRLSLMTNTIVHIQSDLSFFITVEGRRLPDTHMLYQTHKWTITHIHQLVSLLLHLEGLVVCSGSSPTCHLLLTPPCLTCVPCLFQDAEDNASTDEGQDDNSSLI